VDHSPIVLGSFALDVLANSTQVLHQSTISQWGYKYKAIKANLNSTTQTDYNNWQTQGMQVKIDKQEIKALEWRFSTQRDDLKMALE